MGSFGDLARSVGRTCLPRRADYAGSSRSWRQDLVAGLTVGFVALPLALGFGITSGLGAAAGLVTAVVAGIIAAVFGGSRFQVSGPTGAMTVVLVPIVAQHGSAAVILVGLLAGGIVILMALTHLGALVAYLPWPVVEGFTLGIAAIIFLQQMPTVFRAAPQPGENAGAAAIHAVLQVEWQRALPSLALAAATIVVMLLCSRIHRSIPGSLVALILVTAVAWIAHLDVAVVGALPAKLFDTDLTGLPLGELGTLMGPALAVAVLCAIESLLSARVAEQLAGEAASSKAFDPDRELFGQGLATVGSAIFGGMPATGAIARTAVNIRSGARSRIAAIVHAVVLILVIYLIATPVGHVPLAALAGVLIVTSFRMVERHAARSIFRVGRAEALIFVLTAACTVLFDLIVAVEVGLVVAAFIALKQVAGRSSLHVTTIDEHICVLRIDGSLFFAASPRMFDNLELPVGTEVVILRLRDIQVLDASGAATLAQLVRDLRSAGKVVLLKGIQDRHRQGLAAVGVIDQINVPYDWERGSETATRIFSELQPAVDQAHLLMSAHRAAG